MISCQSPRKVLRLAHALAEQFLPTYASRFSRHDFTLPQLFACLVLKEHQRRSYRGAEALLADSPSWRRDIGLKKAPDHNTLARAAGFLLTGAVTGRFLDTLVRWAATARVLGLTKKPLVIDTTYFEPRPVSRHYERRCRHRSRQARRREARREARRQRRRGQKDRGQKDKARRNQAKTRARQRASVGQLPKLALASAADSHLILALETSTGSSADQRHWPGLLAQLDQRIGLADRTAAADSGFDSHEDHVLARQRYHLRALIPPTSGYQGAHPEHVASSRYRRAMAHQLATRELRQGCGYSQRAQSETINSMVKRNYGSAVRGKTAWSRKRDLHLKAITHNVAV